MDRSIRIDVTGAPEAELRLGKLLGVLVELYLALFAAALISVPIVLAFHFVPGAVGAFVVTLAIWFWRNFQRPRRAQQKIMAHGRTLAEVRTALRPLRAGSHRFRGKWLALNVALAITWYVVGVAVLGRSDIALTVATMGAALFVINGMRLWSDKGGFFKTTISYAVIAAVWLLGMALATYFFRDGPWLYPAFLVLGLGIPLWITHRVGPFTQATLEEMRARDPRPPILFIRSFQDEGRPILTSGKGQSFEAILTDALRPYGPFVGIGKPGELRPAGAARKYYPHDAWHDAVLELMHEAGIVAVLPGITPGLDWELNRIGEDGRIRKAIFLFAPHDRGPRFERLRAALSRSAEGSELVHADLRPVLAAHLARDGRWVLITSEFISAGEYQAAVDVAIYGLLGDP